MYLIQVIKTNIVTTFQPIKFLLPKFYKLYISSLFRLQNKIDPLNKA